MFAFVLGRLVHELDVPVHVEWMEVLAALLARVRVVLDVVMAQDFLRAVTVLPAALHRAGQLPGDVGVGQDLQVRGGLRVRIVKSSYNFKGKTVNSDCSDL